MVEFVGYGKISHPKKPFQNYANIIHDYLFQKTCIPEMHFQNDVNIILEMFFHKCFFFFFLYLTNSAIRKIYANPKKKIPTLPNIYTNHAFCASRMRQQRRNEKERINEVIIREGRFGHIQNYGSA